MRHGQHRNYKDNWETPDDVFKIINEAFDNRIILDVACDYSNYKTPARLPIEVYNSLKCTWSTRHNNLYWCNPPFSKKEDFLLKAHEEFRLGSEGIMLLPASLETEWFRVYISNYNLPYLIWPKRISFIDPDTKKPKSGNVGGSALIAFIKDRSTLPKILDQPWKVNL